MPAAKEKIRGAAKCFGRRPDPQILRCPRSRNLVHGRKAEKVERDVCRVRGVTHVAAGFLTQQRGSAAQQPAAGRPPRAMPNGTVSYDHLQNFRNLNIIQSTASYMYNCTRRLSLSHAAAHTGPAPSRERESWSRGRRNGQAEGIMASCQGARFLRR